jgi:hypothetical protein
VCQTNKPFIPRAAATLSVFLLLHSFAIGQSMNQFWGIQGDHIADDALVCVAYDKWNQVGYAAGHSEDISTLGILSSSTTNSNPASLPNASFGDNDIILLKFDDNAQILWAIAIGGTKDDFAFDMTTDNEGNVYLVGSYMYDLNFVSLNNPTAMYFADDGGGNSTSQGFVCSYDSNGQFRWASSEGGNGDDAIHSITNVSDGIAIIGHITHIPGTFPDPLTNTLGGVNTDVYVKKFTHDGSPMWQMAGGSDLDDYEYDEEFNTKKWDIASYSDTIYFGATYSGLTFNFYASTNYTSDNQSVSLLKLSTDPDYVLGAVTNRGCRRLVDLGRPIARPQTHHRRRRYVYCQILSRHWSTQNIQVVTNPQCRCR